MRGLADEVQGPPNVAEEGGRGIKGELPFLSWVTGEAIYQMQKAEWIHRQAWVEAEVKFFFEDAVWLANEISEERSL